MRVFVTGASGWIGSAAVDELVAAGHRVEGLVRSDRAAAELEEKGAIARHGDLDDLDGLRAGAADADAVVHLANKHDWSDPAASNRAERAAVQTIAGALEGSGRRFLFAAGAAGLVTRRPATENDPSPAVGPDSPRGGAENLAFDYVDRGVRPVSVRFAPTVHGVGDHGFVPTIVGVARDRGISGYVGDGANRWSAVHRTDAARVVRLALESPDDDLRVVHAIAEEGVTTREIAEAIAAGLGIASASVDPDDVADRFGWIGTFFGLDMAASSAITRERLGWTPTGPTLLEDLAGDSYYRA